MRNNKNVVLIWDWNGTLVNDSFLFVNIMNDYLAAFGLKKISINDYKESFCFPVSNYYKHLGFSLSKKEFEQLSADFIIKYKKAMFSPSLVPGIKKLLLLFSSLGCRQAVLSAQEQSLLDLSINHYGLNFLFFSVFGLQNTFAESKELLAHSLYNKHCSNKDLVIVIGDTLHDFEVARAIGAHCCLVSYGHNSMKRLKMSGAFVAQSVDDVYIFIQDFLV